MQSDLNAAINLALRGIAHPARAEVHHRVRTERIDSKGGKKKQSAASPAFRTREKRRFGDQQPEIVTAEADSLPKERNSNLFYDPWNVTQFGRVRLSGEGEESFPYASGPGLWKRVNDPAFQWKRCSEINRQRMQKPSLQSADKDEDNVPM